MAESRRPRVLLITRNLPPLVGGMERLNWHMVEELTKVADMRVIGPKGSATVAPTGAVVREAPLRPLWRFLICAHALACREARRWRPDIVMAGSGLAAPLARLAADVCGARTAAYVHGLDVAVKHPVYRVFWLPAIRRMARVIANSHATESLCRDIGVDSKRVGVVHPGVDLPEVFGDGLSAALRERYSLHNRPLLLSVGRLSVRKGLREFVTHALPRIAAVRPDVVLMIVGDAPTQALHAEIQTPQSIQVAADAAGVGHCLKFIGTITDYVELGAVYGACDVHVFPVREIPGDPEGFGMVAVEAAAHGLPTVAFATGGVVDAVAEGRSGHLVRPGDYAAFSSCVLQTLATHSGMRASCVDFARCFAWPEFGLRLVAQLQLQGDPLREQLAAR